MSEQSTDYSDPSGDDFEALSRDKVPVRSMVEGDLQAIIRLDRKITGRDRGAFYQRKLTEVLHESGVRVSLVAEIDGLFAGFLMARVDYGEFGRTASAALIDTLGVEPAYAKKGVGQALMSQLMANLHSLMVEKVQTRLSWNEFELMGFLAKAGFRPSQRLSFRKRLS